MTITVRRADATDVPWMLGQLRDFSKFFDADLSLYPDEDEAWDKLHGLIERHPVFVAENGQRLGFIAGYLTPSPWNSRIVQLTEAFWWVAPEHRGSRAGLLLLDAFVACGDGVADVTSFALETKSPVNARMLARRGFAEYERSYLRRSPARVVP